MSNSTLIKKVIEAEQKALEMRQKSLEDSRISIRNAEEEAGKSKEEALKQARSNARKKIEAHQKGEREKTDKLRQEQIQDNVNMQQDAKKNLPKAVKLIIDMACEVGK